MDSPSKLSQGDPGRTLAWYCGVLATLLAILVIINVLAMLAFHYTHLRNDDWNFHAEYLDFGWASFVIHKYFGHSWVIPKLLFLANLEIFRGSSLQIQFLGLALHTLAAAILAGLLWRHTPPDYPRALSLAAAALVVGGVFWMSRHLEMTWPFMVANTLVVACATVAAWALYRYLREMQAPTGAANNKWLWLIAATGILATFSFSAGLAIWPAAIMVMLLYRAPWAGIIKLGIIASVTTAINMALPSRLEVEITLSLIVQFLPSVQEFVSFFLVFMGTAINFSLFSYEGLRTGLPWFSAILSIAGLMLLAWQTWVSYRRGAGGDAVIAVPLMLAWFAVIAGLMAALGRSSMEGFNNPNDYRYATWSAVFWISLLWLGLYYWLQLSHHSRAWRQAFIPAAVIVLGIFASASFHGITHLLDAHYKHRLGGLAMITAPRIRIDDARNLSPTHIQRRLEVLPEMRRREHNPFDERWTHHIGRSLDAHYQVDRQAQCRGVWRLQQARSDQRSQLYEGWATGPHSALRTLLVVSGDTIIGGGKPAWIGNPRELGPRNSGLPGKRRAFLASLTGNTRGWVAVTNMRFAEPSGEIRIYGILDSETVCRLHRANGPEAAPEPET